MNIQIERATHIMEMWAEDATHGYDQQFRWGERGDYDCSSAVISAWELAGIPVKTKGATYTGNMYSVFRACGFEDVTASIDLVHGVGLHRGDVLLNHRNHTAMYAGGGKTVEASINENGKTTGGTPGDQTSAEFLLRLYRNYPWDCVLRYTGKDAVSENGGTAAPENNSPTYFYTVKLPLLKKGHTGPYVKTLQELLIVKGYLAGPADGVFGVDTESAVVALQGDNGLEVDGEVGGLTWVPVLGGA